MTLKQLHEENLQLSSILEVITKSTTLVFQMTSFRTEHNLTNQEFYTTFKIQGERYYKIRGLVPLQEVEPKIPTRILHGTYR